MSDTNNASASNETTKETTSEVEATKPTNVEIAKNKATTDISNTNNNTNNAANEDTKESYDEIKQNYDQISQQPPKKAEIPQNLETKPIGTKNKIVVGSFEASTFHYSIKNRRDPLDIHMFPTFGYLAVPHIGVYGQSFNPTSLRVLIEVSVNGSLLNSLPNSISSVISNTMSKLYTKIDRENTTTSTTTNNNNTLMSASTNSATIASVSTVSDTNSETNVSTVSTVSDTNPETSASTSVSVTNSTAITDELQSKHKLRVKPILSEMMDVFVCVHASPPSNVCQHFKCDSMTEINMMYHPWLYSDITELDNDQQISRSLLMGVFEGENVYPVHISDVKSTLDRGMPFGCLEERNCQLHGYAFSPCNAHIGRDIQAGHCSFYSYAVTMDLERSVLAYHVFVNDGEMDQLLKYYVREAKNVEQLVNTFQMLALGKVYEHVKLLCGMGT